MASEVSLAASWNERQRVLGGVESNKVRQAGSRWLVGSRSLYGTMHDSTALKQAVLLSLTRLGDNDTQRVAVHVLYTLYPFPKI